MTNEIPYEGLNQYQLMYEVQNVNRPKFKYQLPYSYVNLIQKCWHHSTFKRPSFDTIVKMLETDKGFITSNINEEEYLNYILLIKEQENSFKKNKDTNNHQSSYLKISSHKNIIKGNIFKKENENNVNDSNSENNYFIDLSKIEKKELISKCDTYKLYRFQEIETNKVLLGQMSMLTIQPINKNDLHNLLCELQIIKNFNHPSLLHFVGYSPIDFKNRLKPIIITDYEPFISLENIFKIERKEHSISKYNETQKLIILYGIASGMSYLHSHDVIHRSLKPSNIYLNENLLPKIGDFGLSTRFITSENITFQTISGVNADPTYSAPEVLQSNKFTKSSDVYAFGVIAFEMITNEIPFDDINNKNQIFNEVVIKESRPKLKGNIPNSYRQLISKCWAQDTNERPTFDDIIYLLKANTEFITEQINENKYQEYIQFIELQIKSIKIQENNDFISPKIKQINNCKQKEININYFREEAERGNIECQEFLAKKYMYENDTENMYKYFLMLIEKKNCMVPLEYAVRLYKSEYYDQVFKYFELISKVNHPIALYFIGIMKFSGFGCKQNKQEAYDILFNLSENRIDRASEFLEYNYKSFQM